MQLTKDIYTFDLQFKGYSVRAGVHAAVFSRPQIVRDQLVSPSQRLQQHAGMASRGMTVEEVVLELEGNDESEGDDSSGSEDDFGGYLDEDGDDREDSDHGSEDEHISSEEETGSEEDMDTEVPPVPPYTLQPGISTAMLSGSRPMDYFSLFVDDSMLHHVVAQTNLYAQQYMESHTLAPHSRKRLWQKEEHTFEELQRFLALILVMGLVRYPRVESHWSTSWPYATETFSSVSFMHCESTYRYMHISIHTHILHTGVETRPFFPPDEISPSQ